MLRSMSDDGERVPVSVAFILLAAVGAALFLTNLMRAPKGEPGASVPATAGGLPVVTVPDAIAVQQLDAATDVAVTGWFQQSMPIPCPKPNDPIVPLLNGDCTIDATWLMQDPEGLIQIDANGMGMGSPSSAAFNVVFDGPDISWARPLPQQGISTPTQVVFIGHFDDERAQACGPVSFQLCLDRFLVTQVTWADGVDNP